VVDSGMDLMDLLPRFVGAFYAFGGWVALRTLITNDALDRMLGLLQAETPGRDETIRRWVLGVSSLLTALSGVALALMSRWAVPLFVANLAAQAGWLIWARTAFPPEDAEDARGRRAVINAAVGYSAVTALTIWLDWRGRLGPFGDPIALAVLGVTAAALGAWLLKQLSWDPGSLPEGWDTPFEIEPPEIRQPARLRLEPRIGDWSLWDADDGRGLDHHLYLPEALAARIEAWEQDHHAALDADDAFGPVRFATPEAARTHREAGLAIVAALEEIYGPGTVEGPIYDTAA
jgi:hypothetical protein